MKIKKIYSCGKTIDLDLYNRLIILDSTLFPGCDNEFKRNRDWWVIVEGGKIVAYCGCLYSEGVCIFNRAWVMRKYRGQGIQRRFIRVRLNDAKKKCTTAITYTLTHNIYSANNLIKCGFLLYIPVYQYAGADVLYFKMNL